jgi:hypothetical protein
MRKGDWVKYRYQGIDRTGIVQEIYMDGSYPKIVVKHPEFSNVNTLHYSEVCEIPKPIPLQIGMVIRLQGHDVEVIRTRTYSFDYKCGYTLGTEHVDVYYVVMQYPPSLDSLVKIYKNYRVNKGKDGSYELTKVVCLGEDNIRNYIRHNDKLMECDNL